MNSSNNQLNNDGQQRVEAPRSKSKKELLQELLLLEEENLGKVGNPPVTEDKKINENPTASPSEENKENESIFAPKKKKELTEKQKEALKKGQTIRDENARKRLEERLKKEEEEKRIMEEKLIKKAIAVKKKQIKKQQLLDELSDDEGKPNVSPSTPSSIMKPKRVMTAPSSQTPATPPPPFVFTFV